MSQAIASPTFAVPPPSVVAELAYLKATWRIVPFLFVCYLAAYLDRVNVGFAKLRMLSELHFSETVHGFGAGIFFLGYVLFEVPSNIVMLRVGARLWIARIMITWGLISGAMVFVHSPLAFYALRFLLGVAEAGFIPGILLYLTLWFPAARRAGSPRSSSPPSRPRASSAARSPASSCARPAARAASPAGNGCS